MNAIDRQSTWQQDALLTTIDPKFAFLLGMFFPRIKQFTTSTIEYDVVEGGIRIAPFASPFSLGASSRRRGHRTVTIQPAYIKLLDTVRPSEGFTRMPGETYGGQYSPEERLAMIVAEQIATHHEMIETRWEQMAAEVLFTGKLTITQDNYPTAVADFERDANLTITTGTVWADSGADIVGDIEAAADKINVSSRGSVASSIVTSNGVWDKMRKNASVRELVDTTKNVSPQTQGIELGPRGADKHPVRRGVLSGRYEIWTYDGYYENDAGTAVPFVPANKVLLSAPGGVEGVRYHGAIIDMDAGMQPHEVFTKTKRQWNPSGEEVLTQSAPMLGMRRANATAVLTVG